VERVEREHGRVGITKHGRPAALVLGIEDLEGLEETSEILSDRPVRLPLGPRRRLSGDLRHRPA
jgi:prevent-host-death family protein